MSHRKHLVLQLISFSHAKELWISTGNTQKSRTGRNERRAYSCIISALHMIHSCWSHLVLWRVETRTRSLQVVWRGEIERSIRNQLLSLNFTLFHLAAVFLKDGEAIKHALDYPFSPSQIFSAFFEVAEVWENPVAFSIWSSACNGLWIASMGLGLQKAGFRRHLITLAEVPLIPLQTTSIMVVKDEGAVSNFPFTACV